MSDHQPISPVNPLPPLVVALVILIVGVELIFMMGEKGYIGGPEAIGWRLSAIRTYAFSGDILDWMIANNRFPPEHLMRFLTYPFVHLTFTHMIFVVVLTLALGKMVGEVFGTFALLLVWVLSAIVGALAYGLLLNDPRPLVGGYPSVYGLIGAYTFLLWVNLAGTGARQFSAFSLIALLMGIQLIFGMLFGGGNDWLPDLAGFATGFGLSFLVSPGGWAAFLERIRQRND